ncbi:MULTISPECIES: protein-S-isoprenylcysteine O-methyltransferase [unclassified Rhizobium]|uniref:protein-S-isoprenylcysteine O-methyltransferase n=1 Tax=unclassified Rhizobium TaxID=2613769 RepID=UPI00287F55D4|nr:MULTISPECIES: protein-S-isoprenylcysteine O-methyltransferase [unclassified Rhizobium]
MSLSLITLGKTIWVLGIIAWYFVRRPAARRAKRNAIVNNRRSARDSFGLVAAIIGLAVIPGIYVFSGFPAHFDYPLAGWALALGTIVYAAGIWIFRRTHKELGRNWSISLEIREEHKLISTGPYSVIRHPMYTSFLLMALGQACLLANWFVGMAGLIGFAFLFFLRVHREEKMMIEFFGPQYRDYMDRTKRIIPYLY